MRRETASCDLPHGRPTIDPKHRTSLQGKSGAKLLAQVSVGRSRPLAELDQPEVLKGSKLSITVGGQSIKAQFAKHSLELDASLRASKPCRS